MEVPIEDFVCQKRLLLKPLLPLRSIREYHIRHGCRPFGADTEFFLKLLANGLQLLYVPKPMYYYRITPGSMSRFNEPYCFDAGSFGECHQSI